MRCTSRRSPAEEGLVFPVAGSLAFLGIPGKEDSRAGPFRRREGWTQGKAEPGQGFLAEAEIRRRRAS